jgi:hypothetical protein
MRALVILVVGRLGELRKTHDGIVDMIEVTASVLSLLILLFIFSVLDEVCKLRGVKMAHPALI